MCLKVCQLFGQKSLKTWLIWFDGQWGLLVWPLTFSKIYATLLDQFSKLIEPPGEVCNVTLELLGSSHFKKFWDIEILLRPCILATVKILPFPLQFWLWGIRDLGHGIYFRLQTSDSGLSLFSSIFIFEEVATCCTYVQIRIMSKGNNFCRIYQKQHLSMSHILLLCSHFYQARWTTYNHIRYLLILLPIFWKRKDA